MEKRILLKLEHYYFGTNEKLLLFFGKEVTKKYAFVAAKATQFFRTIRNYATILTAKGFASKFRKNCDPAFLRNRHIFLTFQPSKKY